MAIRRNAFRPLSGLPLLKAFEGALKEGLLLDEALGGILNARSISTPRRRSLPFGAGVPPMTRLALQRVPPRRRPG